MSQHLRNAALMVQANYLYWNNINYFSVCRFEEGYNLKDPEYTAWLKIYHPEIGSPPTSI